MVWTYDRALLRRDDGTVALGVTDKDMRCIFLYAGLYGALERKVLDHELFHASLFSYGVWFPEEVEEAFCGFFDSHAREVIALSDELYYDNIRTVK